MGKIVMPKNSALLEEVEPVLRIYYEAGTWLSNEEYKRQLKMEIGDDQYASSYTKKAQIPSYFGFTEWENIKDVRSLRRITERGKRFYEHLLIRDNDLISEDLMQSLEQTTFGRNNFGCPDSDSDVEPPVLFVRASVELGYLTYKEFAYLLWKLEDCGGNYTDAKREITRARAQFSFDIPPEAQKYTDAKPIMVLIRWGFLKEDDTTQGTREKHIVVAPSVLKKYEKRIRNLKIYNIDKNVFDSDDSEGNGDMETCSAKVETIEQIPEDMTVDELGAILASMYESASNKTTAIHMFGLKYGSVIKKNNYTAVALVAASGINDSYHVEVSKGIRIYESISNNDYGIKFYDPNDPTVMPQKRKLPIIPKRTRTSYPLNTILYGAPGTGKTYATAAFALAIVERKDYKQVKAEPRAAIMSRYNKLIEDGNIEFITFHQSYGYEDFIQGIRPDTKTGQLSFKTVDGAFKIIADRAIGHPEEDYVLIIDEINRAQISKVFGELITLIETDKRWGEENAICVTLPSGEQFAVPNNLYIVGTMNSADKSISLIDTALRRRFEFVEFVPDLQLIADPQLRTVLEKLNDGIVSQLGMTDLLVGHSYFMNRTVDDLCDIMNRNIIPLLYEYFFDKHKVVELQVKKAVEGLNVEVQSSTMGRLKLVEKGSE